MKYSDIFQLETRQTIEDLYKIHFYQEGDWWRAYEWSSYLVLQFPNNLEDKNKLKPTHKQCKENNDGIIFVGLRTSSFDKYLPNMKCVISEDKHMIIDVKDIVSSNFNLDNYINILSEWKNNFPVKENSSHTKEEIKINNNTPPYLFDVNKNTIMSIVFDIMTYNISDNYETNTQFLKETKNKILRLFI